MTKLTEDKKRAFLAILADGGSVTKAAGATGMTRQGWYLIREKDPEFAKAWDDAVEAGTDYLEDVATARAVEKSDFLMALMLKARRREKYSDKAEVKQEISGPGGAEIAFRMFAPDTKPESGE